MTLDLEAIKARAEAATEGPWEAYNANEDTNYGANWCVANEAFHNPPADEDEEWLGLEVHVGDKPDSDFIAHAREDIPALIAEVERLRDIVADVTALKNMWAEGLDNPSQLVLFDEVIADIGHALDGPR